MTLPNMFSHNAVSQMQRFHCISVMSGRSPNLCMPSESPDGLVAAAATPLVNR